MTDERTNERTDERTNEQTFVIVESLSRLKKVHAYKSLCPPTCLNVPQWMIATSTNKREKLVKAQIKYTLQNVC